MSAPPPGRPATFSSTGYEDGFGRRTLVFDRAEGCTLERLALRPEFGVFEAVLRERAARLAEWSDPRVARTRRVHREHPGGALLVDAEVPSGERLLDLLDGPEEGRVEQGLGGVDVAIGFLLEALSALDALHREAGLVHGAVAASRILLRPSGGIVLLDPVFGEILERLAASRARLWSDFDLAMPPGSVRPRFTAATDVSQAVFTSLMLLLGRRFLAHEFPDGLAAVQTEAVEIAEIRGSTAFASSFDAFLRKTLPLGSARGFGTAREAAHHLRDITDAAMGAATCRAALKAVAESLASMPATTRPPATATPIPRPTPGSVARPPQPVPTLELNIEVPVAPSPPTSAPEPTPPAAPPAPPAEPPAPSAQPPAPPAEPAAPPATATAPAPPASPRQRTRERRRKDALRSTAAPNAPEPMPAALAPRPENKSERRAPIVVVPPPPPQPVFPSPGTYGSGQPAVPSPYVAAADRPWPGAAHVSQPAAPWSPDAWQPAAAPSVPRTTPRLRLKDAPPVRTPAPRLPSSDERIVAPHVQRGSAQRRGFPWKIAAAAAIVILAGAAAGRGYLSAPADTTPSPRVVDAAAVPAPSTGSLVLTSTPEGARVFVDGQAAGETPVTLEGIAPGGRVVTLVSTMGTVRRTVRVRAGETATLDIPVFSGWLAVDAPVLLEVSARGRVIGTSQQRRLLLPPGRHTIMLSNSELHYRATHVVEIEPGEEHRLTIVPATPVNLNAVPWAEVWIDGRRVGETPIANVAIPLGTREIVFRHPEFGERRVAPTIKAGDPAAISVDFTRPGQSPAH